MYIYPLPRLPRGRLENLRAPRPLAAPPRFKGPPAPPAAAPRQGSRGFLGPSSLKCLTTHFREGPSGLPLAAPRPSQRFKDAFNHLRSARVPHKSRQTNSSATNLAMSQLPREPGVSLRPHAISGPRPVTRPQASSAFRAKPTKFAPFPLERPKPCETPFPLRAHRGRVYKYI